MEFLKEFFLFLLSKKKLWLLPIYMIMFIFGALLLVAEGSVMAPFIYTLF